jgi:hypothetical protein
LRSGGCSLFVAPNIFALFLALFSSAQIAASPVRVARRTSVQRAHQVAKGAGFPGAPRTQADGNGVSTGACPLAAPNRYLPARSGCLTVRRAGLAGDALRDLILVYSHLSGTRVRLPGRSGLYAATGAALRIVAPDGRVVTSRLSGQAAVVLGLAHVNDDRGEELFLQTSQISSGANAVAYGLISGRLISAGVTFSYGGDSASRAGFGCSPGAHGRVEQRTFELLSAGINGWWKQTDVTYAWHGPRLVAIAERTSTRRGQPPLRETAAGTGCHLSAGRRSRTGHT